MPTSRDACSAAAAVPRTNVRRSMQPPVSGAADCIPGYPAFGAALDQRHDVAVGILEPGGLVPGRGQDAVDGLQAGHVVVLEHHALLLQSLDFGLESSTCQNAWLAFEVPAPRRGIEEHPRAFARTRRRRRPRPSRGARGPSAPRRNGARGARRTQGYTARSERSSASGDDTRRDSRAGSAGADGRAAIGAIVRPGSILVRLSPRRSADHSTGGAR